MSNLLWTALATGCAAGRTRPERFPIETIKFVPHRIGSFRSEACGVGDFNNDEKLDVTAGPYLYLAPDWKPKKIRMLKGEVDEKGKGYQWDFMNAPLDVDGDGLLDVVSRSSHEKRADWLRNTGAGGGVSGCVLLRDLPLRAEVPAARN